MNQWISVEDRLPEEWGIVWVKTTDESLSMWLHPDSLKVSGGCSVALATYCNKEYGWQDAYTLGDREGLSVEYYHNVTHWMPLLKPPKDK